MAPYRLPGDGDSAAAPLDLTNHRLAAHGAGMATVHRSRLDNPSTVLPGVHRFDVLACCSAVLGMLSYAVARTTWTIADIYIYPHGVPYPSLPDLLSSSSRMPFPHDSCRVIRIRAMAVTPAGLG